MFRLQSHGRPASTNDVLDLLRIDGGQLTVAELLGQRALAVAEIAKLRTRIQSLTNSAAARPNPTPPGAKEGRRTTAAAAAHSTQPVATNRTEPSPPNALIRLTDVCRLVGLSRSTIYRRVSDGTFPRPLRVSERSVRWRMQHILDWSARLAEWRVSGGRRVRNQPDKSRIGPRLVHGETRNLRIPL